MQYIISEKATEDLDQIWQYTYFQWSEHQADKYYNLLIQKIELIAQNAVVGRRMDDIKEGYRYLPVGSHIIFYKNSEDNVVTIIRILHQRMDIPNRLND
jgi:toxin ParE1/3/4